MLEDEKAAFQSNSDLDFRKKYLSFVGCTVRETGMFQQQEADGIIGLGRHTNTSSIPPTIVQVEASQGRSSSELYSLCYGLDGGYLSIGGYDTSRHLNGSQTETFSL